MILISIIFLLKILYLSYVNYSILITPLKVIDIFILMYLMKLIISQSLTTYCLINFNTLLFDFNAPYFID